MRSRGCDRAASRRGGHLASKRVFCVFVQEFSTELALTTSVQQHLTTCTCTCTCNMHIGTAHSRGTQSHHHRSWRGDTNSSSCAHERSNRTHTVTRSFARHLHASITCRSLADHVYTRACVVACGGARARAALMQYSTLGEHGTSPTCDGRHAARTGTQRCACSPHSSSLLIEVQRPRGLPLGVRLLSLGHKQPQAAERTHTRERPKRAAPSQ